MITLTMKDELLLVQDAQCYQLKLTADNMMLLTMGAKWQFNNIYLIYYVSDTCKLISGDLSYSLNILNIPNRYIL